MHVILMCVLFLGFLPCTKNIAHVTQNFCKKITQTVDKTSGGVLYFCYTFLTKHFERLLSNCEKKCIRRKNYEQKLKDCVAALL